MHRKLRIEDPDAFYERLIELHADRSAADSELINAKLILMMANEIGDQRVLLEILQTLQENSSQNVPRE
ncbi:MAG: DUF2783 domain-containing protein [Woeseiaceae bacterium]